jgi:hypothetical protein
MVNNILTNQTPKGIKIIDQSDLDASHLHDDKHIRRECVKMMAGNMKTAIRENSRPSSPRYDRKRSDDAPPRFRRQGGSGSKGDQRNAGWKDSPPNNVMEQMMTMMKSNNAIMTDMMEMVQKSR